MIPIEGDDYLFSDPTMCVVCALLYEPRPLVRVGPPLLAGLGDGEQVPEWIEASIRVGYCPLCPGEALEFDYELVEDALAEPPLRWDVTSLGRCVCCESAWRLDAEREVEFRPGDGVLTLVDDVPG